MKTDAFILIVKTPEDFPEKDGYLEELFEYVKRNGELLNSFRTTFYDNKIRRINILGLDFDFFVRDGLYYRINTPEFERYISQIQSVYPENVLEGFQKFNIQRKNNWHLINLNTLNYYDKQYQIILLIKY